MKLYSVVPYLLLMSFLSGSAADFSSTMALAVKQSPYDGVAIAYQKAYEHDDVDQEYQESMFKEITKISGKDVWPWVFLNRIVAHIPGTGHGSPKSSEKDYFLKIKGIDVSGDYGELGGFMKNWRGALRTARDCGSPGVVLDLEAYNNYGNYSIPYIAGEMEKPEDEVRDGLLSLGADMADIAAEEYPDAVVWSFFSGLGNKQRCNSSTDPGCTSVALISMGFLDRCKEKGYRLTFVSGGEWGLGYCSKNAKHLHKKIKARKGALAGPLAEYPNLRLGGTLAPWSDCNRTTGWLKKTKSCATSNVKVAHDFVPLFRQLFINYDYVWMYVAAVGGYDPFNVVSSKDVDDALMEGMYLSGRRVPKGYNPEPGPVPAEAR